MQQLINNAQWSKGEIGWHLFIWGMCLEAWTDAQRKHDQQYPPKHKRDTDAWAGILVNKVLKFSIACWTSQNKHVQRVTITEQNL